MAANLRIAIIGAGSAQFSLKLIRDLCLAESLKGTHVCFMDTDPLRLEMVHVLATRYASAAGAHISCEATTNRADSLHGADFVINAAYVKGHYHERAERAVKSKHGYYYDGVHLGDFYQLRLALDLARDMESLCPDAWLIQLANPVFDCCTLVLRETRVKVCGLCHGYQGVYEIAETLGLSPERISWQAPGLNHDIWLTHFTYDGEDAYPLIDEWIATKAEEYWRTHMADRPHDIQMSRAAVDQYRMFSLFPVGDTVRRGGGFSAGNSARRGEWWHHTDLPSKKHWFGEPWGGPDTDEGRAFFVAQLQETLREIARLAADPSADLIRALGHTPSDEPIVPLIESLMQDKERVFQINVANRGAIEGIPDDVVVEVPALVSAKGIQPVHVGRLPTKLTLEVLLPHWLDMERNLFAFRSSDRSMLLWSALESQQTRHLDQAATVVEDLLALEGNREMAEHYTYPPRWPSLRGNLTSG